MKFKIRYQNTPGGPTASRPSLFHMTMVKRSKIKIFNNDVIALENHGSFYDLCLSIEKYDNKNSQCFLVDITNSGGNRLLKCCYGYYKSNIIDDWKHYQNDKGEVLFYLNKK